MFRQIIFSLRTDFFLPALFYYYTFFSWFPTLIVYRYVDHKTTRRYNKIKRVEDIYDKYLKRTLDCCLSHDYYIFHNHALAAASSQSTSTRNRYGNDCQPVRQWHEYIVLFFVCKFCRIQKNYGNSRRLFLPLYLVQFHPSWIFYRSWWKSDYIHWNSGLVIDTASGRVFVDRGTAEHTYRMNLFRTKWFGQTDSTN